MINTDPVTPAALNGAGHNGNGATHKAQRLHYATSLESTPANIAPSYGHFIGGAFVPSSGGETFETTNPSTGAVLSRVAYGTTEDVDSRRCGRAQSPTKNTGSR